MQNVTLYSYEELATATDNFSPRNRIDEGGSGSLSKVVALVNRIHLYSFRILTEILLVYINRSQQFQPMIVEREDVVWSIR